MAIKAVGKHLAGKTGTTNEAKDLWFIGYSPDLCVGVYIGYDRPRSMGDHAQAALYAAPIFRDFMTVALKDKPDVPFRVPPGIIHLYQGFGGFIGNAVMGIVFASFFLKYKRVGPLVFAHAIIDSVAFVGYAFLKGHLPFLH